VSERQSCQRESEKDKKHRKRGREKINGEKEKDRGRRKI
jgi:hypothetical protein